MKYFLVAGYVTPIVARITLLFNYLFHLIFVFHYIFVKSNMSEDAQDPVKLDVRYVDVKRGIGSL